MNIKEIFIDFCKQEKLNIELSFDMEEGYEEANGSFDVEKNTLYYNDRLLQSYPKYEQEYYLFHELRHGMQYVHPELFSKEIQDSRLYVIMYNGICYKLVSSHWKECQIHYPSEALINFYASQPHEIDANQFAYEMVQKRFGASSELDALYHFWLPKINVSADEMQDIYRLIDKEIIKN